MKKVAVVVLVMALLMMLFAAPVMATPRESSPAWHSYLATDTYYEVTYAQLTTECLAAGLSENPYPAPTTPNDYYVGTVHHVEGAPAYFVFTITIGDEVYTGVSCCTYDMTLDMSTGEGHWVYQSTHYFGALGKMNHGFVGVVTMDMVGFGYYWIVVWSLQGFGHFTGQSLMLTQEAGETVATGYCLMLGNKWYR